MTYTKEDCFYSCTGPCNIETCGAFRRVDTIEHSGDFELHESRSDAGQGVSFRCPKCECRLNVHDSGWWDNICSCGYKWDIEIVAKGERYFDSKGKVVK